MKYTWNISFDKIVDPFAEVSQTQFMKDISEPFLDKSNPLFRSFMGQDNDEEDEEDDEKELFSDFETDSVDVPQVKVTKGIVTPSGIMPVTKDWNPYSGYFAHTNFVITKNIQLILQSRPGVESIKILSPYRFRISFGRWFDEKAVQNNLVAAVRKYQDTVYN